MSEDWEYDPYEYAKELAAGQDVGRSDFAEPRRTEDERGGMSRRELLVRGGAAAAAVGGLGALAGPAAAATSKSGAFTGTLNVISLGVEWPQGVQAQAEKDLGFKFQVSLADSATMVQKMITAPGSFDIFGGYNYQYMQGWPAGSMMPVDRTRVTAWETNYKLFRYGKVNPASKSCTYGQGNAPFRAMYVDPNGKSGLPLTPQHPVGNKSIVIWIDEKTGKPYTGKAEPRGIVGPPAHFNMDSMGYNGDVITKDPSKMSWAELLNKKYAGRVAVLKDPGIVCADLGNAVQALGLMKFANLGDMTKAEMDRLFKILSVYRKAGHFKAFWASFTESVNLLASKEVVIESMWSPAVALLVAQGVNCRYAAPPEGFRGWCSATGIAKHVGSDPARLQACYDYINWMNQGWFGAAIMRQGYYISNGVQLRSWINSPTGKAAGYSPDEYAYWYGGAPAATDLPGITGNVGDVKKGQVRDGGSFVKRACKYTAWNSYFRNSVYQVKKANEFFSA
jgi:putative spermidine/putrescine transport system substrate-binding protein